MKEVQLNPLSEITVVSVCYKSDAVIGGMVNSIPPETPIILVDNGGLSDLAGVSARPNVEIIGLARNVGFGRGCNEGAAKAKTPWLLFLNPDARLEAGALEALLAASLRYPEASAFNPRITRTGGGEYFKRRSYLLSRREHMRRGWPAGDCRVPVLSGAALFVSKKNFDAAGGFDPAIFLYHEDDDLSIRLRDQVGPLMFVHDAVVTHANGHSSERSPEIAYFKAYHMAKSRIYVGRKHGKPLPILSATSKALQLWISPATWISRRKTAKARGLTKGILSAFKRPGV